MISRSCRWFVRRSSSTGRREHGRSGTEPPIQNPESRISNASEQEAAKAAEDAQTAWQWIRLCQVARMEDGLLIGKREVRQLTDNTGDQGDGNHL